MREVELKGVVPDAAAARARLEQAGARLVFSGRLEDRCYDGAERRLAAADQVLRLRVYRDGDGTRAALDWKGPTRYDGGYKVREELTTSVGDPAALAAMLEALGYTVSREIDRRIVQYELGGATVRFEEYPRMDVLVEVEGEPDAIERAVGALGISRAAFTTDRLPQFIERFEARTGQRAAICDRELDGDYRYSALDA